MSRISRCLTTLLLIIFYFAFISGVRAQQGGTTRYVYDDNGRLRAVVSPTGEAAIYDYDPAGNITNITRQPAGFLSIISFTPKSGSENTLVTIGGTGFSATPGANTVKFNGATAVIVSANITEIVARVPTGATTGPITVTTANGTATSSEPFTVNVPPVITGFPPAAGRAGTVVTIAGDRFENTVFGNRVAFNGTPAEVTAATTTAISAIVPPFATSGPITVTTSRGTASSSDDFII